MEQPTGGWIKLFRSLADHGHLQMPDQALKVWIFLLLSVNHTPNAGCAAGEGWITYRRIREACCDPSRPQWSDHTISKALDYLERNGYIRRIKTKNGAAQRIRIVNWHKYQGQTSALTAEVRAEVGAEVSAEKQEDLRMPRREDEKAMAAASKAETWYQFYERKFARTISPVDYQKVAELQARGVTDELIIHVLEEAIRQKKRNKLGWVISVIADKIPEGIRTLDDWLRREREVAAAAQTKGADKPDRRRPLRDPIATADTPRSKWEVQMLPEDLGEPTEQRPPGSDSRAAVG